MNSRTLFIASITMASIAASVPLFAKDKVDINPKDTRTYSERERDRNWAEAKKGYDIIQSEKTKEQMRDKTHDNRMKTGKDTSVGIQTDPAGINVRKSIP